MPHTTRNFGLDAFDLTGSLRDAGELAGVSHHTVARYDAVRDRGLAARGVTRPMLIDEFLPKVEEWIDRSNGKARADVAHDKLVAVGFTGSERTTRRAVAAVKKNYRCLLYTSPSPRDGLLSRMPSSA